MSRPIKVYRAWLKSVEHPDGPHCTGIGASWCPTHGDCTCHRWPDGDRSLDDRCPLHA